jgi:hypothetical protein
VVFVTLPRAGEGFFEPDKGFCAMPSPGSSSSNARGTVTAEQGGGDSVEGGPGEAEPRPAELRGLHPGSKFKGSQCSGRSSYDVEVELQVGQVSVVAHEDGADVVLSRQCDLVLCMPCECPALPSSLASLSSSLWGGRVSPRAYELCLFSRDTYPLTYPATPHLPCFHVDDDDQHDKNDRMWIWIAAFSVVTSRYLGSPTSTPCSPRSVSLLVTSRACAHSFSRGEWDLGSQQQKHPHKQSLSFCPPPPSFSAFHACRLKDTRMHTPSSLSLS